MGDGGNASSPECNSDTCPARAVAADTGQGRQSVSWREVGEPWAHLQVGSMEKSFSLPVPQFAHLSTRDSRALLEGYCDKQIPGEKCSTQGLARAEYPDKHARSQRTRNGKGGRVEAGEQDRAPRTPKRGKQGVFFFSPLLSFSLPWAKDAQEGCVWKDPKLERWLFWINGDTWEEGHAVLSKTTQSNRIILCLQKFQNFKYSSLKTLILKQLPYFQFENDACCSLGPLQETRPLKFLPVAL